MVDKILQRKAQKNNIFYLSCLNEFIYVSGEKLKGSELFLFWEWIYFQTDQMLLCDFILFCLANIRIIKCRQEIMTLISTILSFKDVVIS